MLLSGSQPFALRIACASVAWSVGVVELSRPFACRAAHRLAARAVTMKMAPGAPAFDGASAAHG